MLNARGIEHLINFQVHFDCIEALFYNRKINIYGIYVLNKEIRKECFSNSKKRRFTTVISHVNKNGSNNLNKSKSDNVIGTSNLTHRNIKIYSLFNKLINFLKVIDTQSSVSINYEIMY